MAGGRWTSQNKILPGAYINYKAENRVNIGIGNRGTVALPVPLSWGDDSGVITVTVGEFLNGTSEDKIGISIMDEGLGAQMLREAFKGASTARIFKINGGGTKATADLAADLKAVARYTGAAGNNITVIIAAADEGMFKVSTLYRGDTKDVQIVGTAKEFKANNWIDSLSGDGDIEITSGVTLGGGTDGTETPQKYTAFFDVMSGIPWNCIAIPDATAAATAKTYISNLRNNEGYYVSAVVSNLTAPNHEGIINTRGQGYKTATETVSPEVFTVWVAGWEAGAQINQSNTNRVIDGATDVINPLKPSEIEEAITHGCYVIAKRQDGKIAVVQDINSLTTYTQDLPEEWHKNRVRRTMDDLSAQIKSNFETNFNGVVDNNERGRNSLRESIVVLFNQAQGMNAIQNFVPKDDVSVIAGNSVDSVVTNIAAQSVDSMEKLYATITLKA